MSATPELAPRRWAPRVYAALTGLLDEADALGPAPLAVFDCDNTCIHGDLGEALHRTLSHNLAFDFGPTFFARLHADDGAERITSLWRTLQDVDPDAAPSHPPARALSRALIAAYYRRYRREGRGPTYRWVTQLLAGMPESTLRGWVEETLRRELRAPIDTRHITLPDGETITYGTGLRVQPEIRELIACMHARGFEVWLVSASNLWTIQGIAPHLGVPAERVLTHELVVDEAGVLTDALIEPVTFRQGKVDAIRARLGRRPVFAAGDSVTDLEMLRDATHGRLVIERGDAHLQRAVSETSPEDPPWWVQPAFSW